MNKYYISYNGYIFDKRMTKQDKIVDEFTSIILNDIISIWGKCLYIQVQLSRIVVRLSYKIAIYITDDSVIFDNDVDYVDIVVDYTSYSVAAIRDAFKTIGLNVC